MSEKPPATRSHEHALEIQASPGDVWKAITDPAEIARWFALAAETRPGQGGEIVYRWGDFAGRCTILAWEPPKHLRTSWMEAPASPAGQGAALVVDWHIEGQGGTTTLRLVHSGFGPGAEFEREYDGTRRGWTFELQGLKHYLERSAVGSGARAGCDSRRGSRPRRSGAASLSRARSSGASRSTPSARAIATTSCAPTARCSPGACS